MLRCPTCDSVRVFVMETRAIGNALRRRRKCRACNNNFTTYEIHAPVMAYVLEAADAIKSLSKVCDALSTAAEDYELAKHANIDSTKVRTKKVKKQ